MRTHSTLGYELLQGRGYSDFVLESILYHHEIMTEPGIRPIWREKRFRLGRVSYASVMCTAR